MKKKNLIHHMKYLYPSLDPDTQAESAHSVRLTGNLLLFGPHRKPEVTFSYEDNASSASHPFGAALWPAAETAIRSQMVWGPDEWVRIKDTHLWPQKNIVQRKKKPSKLEWPPPLLKLPDLAAVPCGVCQPGFLYIKGELKFSDRRIQRDERRDGMANTGNSGSVDRQERQ